MLVYEVSLSTNDSVDAVGAKLFDAALQGGVGGRGHGDALWVVGCAAPSVLVAAHLVVGQERDGDEG